MTLPHEHHEGFIERKIDEALSEIQPIPVHLVKDDTQEVEKTADFGAWSTYVLQGVAGEVPFRILPYSVKRRRAVLAITPGIAANATGFVAFGSRNQINNGNAALGLAGGRLISGQTISLENMGELWMSSDQAHSLTVTVIDEQYRVDSPEDNES